jgi:hypothetical protein
MISRESFLAAAAPAAAPRIEVPIPALGEGETVFVRPMTAGERDRFEQHQVKDPHTRFRSRILIASVCDENGLPMFTEADTPQLENLPSPIVEPILLAALRANKLRDEDLDDTRKNSASGPASGSDAGSL